MARVISENSSKKPVIDEKKSYKWEPTDIFDLTGQGFAVLYHMINAEVTTPVGATIQQKFDAYQILMDLFKKGVEQGVIVETNIPSDNIEEAEIKSLFKR